MIAASMLMVNLLMTMIMRINNMHAEIAKQAFIEATLNIPCKIINLEFITLYEYNNGYIKTIGNITGIINYFKNK